MMNKVKILTLLSVCFLVLLSISSHHAAASSKRGWIWQPERTATARKDVRQYVRMADNFFVFYDPSTAMSVPYKNTGMTKLEKSKEILLQSNASLPELNWQAGLYPHWRNVMWLAGAEQGFSPYYRLRNYEREPFGAALEQLPVRSSGPPMLQIALMKLEHLLGLPGRTEVFMFTNGAAARFAGVDEPEPLAQAKMLAEKYDVCFNLISSATNMTAEKLLNDIAQVNDCSQVIDFDTVAEHPEHLFGKLYMPANSPFANVLFAFDSSKIGKEYRSALDRLGRHLLAQPRDYAVLSGFCDSIGSKNYNLHLSRRRAESARKYLLNNFPGLNKKRILLYWYGSAKPVASNTTKAGRQLNRRVTIRIRTGG